MDKELFGSIIKDDLMGIPKSDLLGVTVALILEAIGLTAVK